MTIREFILTFERDGKIVANLFDYYDKFIKHLDKNYEQYSYYESKLVRCYFKDHEDPNPSMGWRYASQMKGVKICHCFGCHRSADVVRLHQILRKQYDGVDLSEQDSCSELAQMFEIPLDEFDELADDDYEGKFNQNFKKLDALSRHYTSREFASSLVKIRKTGVDLNKVNDECIKMIATVKNLYY